MYTNVCPWACMKQILGIELRAKEEVCISVMKGRGKLGCLPTASSYDDIHVVDPVYEVEGKKS